MGYLERLPLPDRRQRRRRTSGFVPQRLVRNHQTANCRTRILPRSETIYRRNPADRTQRALRKVENAPPGGQLRHCERPQTNLDPDPLLPPLRRPQLRTPGRCTGRNRRPAHAPRPVRLARRRSRVALLPRRHDEGRREDSLLHPGISTRQTPDGRRRTHRYRLRKHGFPEFRAQFRGQCLRLRCRFQCANDPNLRARRATVSHPDSRRMVQSTPLPPLGGIPHAGLFPVAVRSRERFKKKKEGGGRRKSSRGNQNC